MTYATDVPLDKSKPACGGSDLPNESVAKCLGDLTGSCVHVHTSDDNGRIVALVQPPGDRAFGRGRELSREIGAGARGRRELLQRCLEQVAVGRCEAREAVELVSGMFVSVSRVWSQLSGRHHLATGAMPRNRPRSVLHLGKTMSKGQKHFGRAS